jgi:hypothetical protein
MVEDRNHFFAVAARAMRHLIVDYARGRTAVKRGGSDRPFGLDEADGQLETKSEEILALNQALERLSTLDEGLTRVVEMRFFRTGSFGR